MAIDAAGYIFLISFFIIYGVFVCWDFFRRGEKYGFLAYVLAVIPADMLWFYELNILLVYTILFVLWIVCLMRDLFLVYGKTKEYDDILLFLALGILVQLVLTAILPADQLNRTMQENNALWGFFWFPDVYNPNTNMINDWVNSSYLLAFRAVATLMVALAILPMILDLQSSEEHISLLAIIIIDAIFILPFLWLAYVWMGGIGWPLTFLFAVILFIILLMLTREK